MSGRIEYEYSDGVATITMNDGKVNIMSTAMLADIRAALDRAERDQAMIVLRSGLPNIFSAGFDLKIFAAQDAKTSLEMVRSGAELALSLLKYPHPTIGIMEGHAFPMGAFLLLSCDVRIATEGTHKMGLNEVAIGISPPGFAIELSRSRMHPSWHSRTVILGEMFEPEDALTAGLLDRVVPDSALNAVLDGILSGLRNIHQPSHAMAKKRLRRPVIKAMREAIEAELTLEAYSSPNRLPSAVVLPGT